jgi:hypothetical protein
MTQRSDLDALVAFLARLPAIELPAGTKSIGRGVSDGGAWWVKFSLDLEHRLVWRVVQELAHVLNLLAIDEGLATSFKPVSPPPYMNGGPDEFLSWVIEGDARCSPTACLQWLEGRLPQPVDEAAEWSLGDEDDDDGEDEDDE